MHGSGPPTWLPVRSEPCHVVVMGGGWAGLAAARTLLMDPSAACRVTLLEAKDRLGGRVHSVPLMARAPPASTDVDDNALWGSDLGGMFWHGASWVQAQLAADLNFLHNSSITTAGDSAVPGTATWWRYAEDVHASTTNPTATTPTRPYAVTDAATRTDALYDAWTEAMQARGDAHAMETQDDDEAATVQRLALWSREFLNRLDDDDDARALLELRLTLSFAHDRGVPWEQHAANGLATDWDWVDWPGPDTIAQNGMQVWTTALAEDIVARGGAVHLEERVVQMDSTQQPCRVTTESGRIYEADHVVCTLPLGVLKAQADTLFTPPLPELQRDALRRAGVGVLNTLVVRWNRHLPLASTPGDPPNATAFYFLQSPHAANPLRHGFVCTDRWRQHGATVTQFHFGETLGLPFDDIDYWKRQAVQVVQDVVLDEQLDVSQIVAAEVSAWHLDPDMRGSYSAATTLTRGNVDRQVLASPVPGGRLFFAGEHTHYAGRYQSMDGAYETGVRAASQVVAAIWETAMGNCTNTTANMPTLSPSFATMPRPTWVAPGLA
jgi:monoamine oxidase